MSAAFTKDLLLRNTKVDEACARLRAAGMRITQPRIAMINLMLRHPEPRSLDEMHQDLAGACDLVTLYRSIGSMHEIGLVRRIFTRSGTSLYQLELSPERYHLVTKSDEIISLEERIPSEDMRLALQRVEDVLRAKGYTSVSHVVQFFVDGRPDSRTISDIAAAGGYITGL